MLTIATVVAMSASFSWGQCCGGASYDSVGMAAPAVVDGGAGGCGCSYTVMRTVRRTVYEQQQVQRTRTQYSTVYETKQVPTTRTAVSYTHLTLPTKRIV